MKLLITTKRLRAYLADRALALWWLRRARRDYAAGLRGLGLTAMAHYRTAKSLAPHSWARLQTALRHVATGTLSEWAC